MTSLIESAKSSDTSSPAQASSLSARASVGAVSSLLTVCAGLSATEALAKPPLPTPCLASNCGPNAQQFVQYGKAGAVVSGNTMNVTQSTNQAILNWADFNIANGYTVNFLQPSSTSSVLNKIWSADPSVIAGALKANGQVYLYNQNGIVFDKGAQVNVGSLTATTLAFAPVSGSTDPDALYKNGLLTNNTTGNTPPVFETCTGASCTSTPGGVTVNAGATLTAADGGRIMLIGSAVTNNGTISTPDGQTLLAAGSQVYLAASTDPALRGLLIEVGAGGAVTNNGVVTADRGNITLAGMVVNQTGQLTATTSVSANGSIYLVAGDVSPSVGAFVGSPQGFGHLLPNEGGTATLAPGSVTQVLPDSTDTGTISEQTLASAGGFQPSQVAVVGQTVALVGNASIHAPGANVTLSAAANPALQSSNTTNSAATNDGGRIYLDSGSSIDVSGLQNVAVPVTQNILKVTLEGTDLADDPLLRNGFLHGQTVYVNANQGSPLFNVTPYKNNISLGIDQVLTSGGTISLNTEGDVIAHSGSTMNVSGGSVAYQGGYAPSTTQLIAANGKVYDIGDAPANLQYTGLANSFSYVDPTWGTQTNASTQSYYAGYIQGSSAGTIQVLGPQMYLGGSMLGSTVAGPYQRQSTPPGGQILLGCNCSISSGVDFRAPAVVFLDNGPDTLPANFNYLDPTASLPASLQDVVELSPTALEQSGFNRFTVFSNGAVTLPQGGSIALAPGGSLSVTSDQLIDIAGTIHAAGGTLSLATVGSSAGDSTPHDITIGAGAVIDVSGTWVNDSPLVNGNVLATDPIAISGGKISLSASGNVIIGDDSRLDVSGGGWISNTNSISKGNAGSISLTASLQANSTASYTGEVQIGTDAALVGNSLASGGGGQLSITSGSVTLGWQPNSSPGELLLLPSFFSNQGFQSYNITGQNDVTVGSLTAALPSVLINPIEENLVFSGDPFLARTGTSLESFTQLQTLPASQRTAANIALTTTSSSTVGPSAPDAGNLFVAQNASIVTDPLGSVTLTANSTTGSITVLGSISAPAGAITLQLGQPFGAPFHPSGAGYVAGQEILLGPNASLEAPAYAQVDTLDTPGYREGSVLQGGSVSLAANRGYVVTDPGSIIDVSGVAATLDIVNSQGVTATTVAGNAGSIAIDAREGLVLQGVLRGEAAQVNGTAVAGAAGGTLSVGLDLFDYGGTVYANANASPSGGGTNYPLNPRTLTLTNQPAVQLPTDGVATISEQSLTSGGFDNLVLKSADIISIAGAVTLSTKASITLDAPLLQAGAGASLQLASAHVLLGNYFNATDYFDAANGLPLSSTNAPQNPVASEVLGSAAKCFSLCTGSLSVQAQLIDIRGVSGWAGFNSENLTSSGDIRFSSAQTVINTPPPIAVPAGDASDAGFRSGLYASGTLNLTAQQAYPTTYTDFTISAGSSVNILPATGTAAAPLSAGGILTINAPTIDQSGVLRAPLGEITLSGTTVALENGSITSVSADGETIPYGSTQNGQQWTYSPESGYTNVVTAPPAKTVNLNGDSVFVQKGATVDVSGGGDLLASEWIAGPGGSTDVLNPQSAANQAGVKAYQYAIVPGLGSQFAPIDAQFNQQAVGANQTIYLSGVPGLAAGYYALLPARYALLPGAFAVRVVQSNSDQAIGSAVRQSSGAYLVAGKLGAAGTDTLDSRTSTFLVAPSSVVQNQSQYTLSAANTFFSSAAATAQTAAPALPADAGALQISATKGLTLNGSINFTPSSFTTTNSSGNSTVVQGVGGSVSVQAPVIAVADSATALASLPSGALVLDAQSLDNLGASTVILGGTATRTSAGEQITVGTTQTIELANATQALSAPDIILAAQNGITVDAGAEISAKGTLNQSPTTLVVNGAGALLRASSGSLASIEVDQANGSLAQNTAATLSIGSAANLSATGSLLLYATGNTTAASDVALSVPALGVYSSRVSLGDVPTGTNAPAGLNLTTQLLTTLASSTDLTIGSTSTIDFYGAVSLGTGSLQNLTLNAAALDGYDTAGSKANVALQAGSITFANSNAASLAYDSGITPTGTGSLTLTATAGSSTQSGQITLGSGNKTISGFGGGIAFNAAGDIQTQGTGASLSVPGSGASGSGTPVSLSLTSAALTAAAGSDQTIYASGTVNIAQAAASSASLPAAPLGGKLVIESGAAINQNGTIDLPAGIIELHAANGDVVLDKGSVTSTAGAISSFTTTNAAAAGGQISLIADQGNVTLTSGSTIDVAGASSADGKVNGDAGSLTVSASHGSFAFAGSTLEGSAANGQLQGNFTLDVSQGLAGSGFATLTDALQSGGFTGDLNLRTRGDSDVIIANTTSHPGGIVASSFTLTTDQGSIDVQGEINTSGGNALNTGGGAISLWTQNNLTLESSAQLLANATAPGPLGVNGVALAAKGGNVTLGVESGTIDLKSGSQINLSGSDANSGGILTLRAPVIQAANASCSTPPCVGVAEIASNITGVTSSNPVIVEGFNVYQMAGTATTPATLSLSTGDVVVGTTASGAPIYGSLAIGSPNTTNSIGVLYTNAQSLLSNSGTITAALLKNSPNASLSIQLRPGIEIQSSTGVQLNGASSNGDLQVGDPGTKGVWDLDSWNLALGAPVDLSLRAGGNLVFNASLSDGFNIRSGKSVQQWFFGEQPASSTSPGNPDSASYRLTAAADLTSADPLAVIGQAANPVSPSTGSVSGTGNVVVTPGQVIRTGDGSIQLAAGGDVLLGYSADPSGTFTPSYPLTTSAIYTAGVPTVSAPVTNVNVAAYPTHGGDVTVVATNDIRSAPGAENPSDWLWRQGAFNSDGSIKANTSWWIEFSLFQGIGALGSGNVSLDAGGNIVDVTAAIPSTGRLSAAGQQQTFSNFVLDGGGTLVVRAAGDISSGLYEDDWGNALLAAGGALNASATVSQEVPASSSVSLTFDPTKAYINPLLFIGSGDFTASARTGAEIDFVGNSTAIPESVLNAARLDQSSFFTYGAASALTVQSTAGNVVFDNDTTNLSLSLLDGNHGLSADYLAAPVVIYPATLNATALSGDIEFLNSSKAPVPLFPSADGNLDFLAQGSITGDTSPDSNSLFWIKMYESDPLQWANVVTPEASGLATVPAGANGGQLPATPLHQADSQPVNIVAQTGSISPAKLDLPKAANIVAGGSIDDLTLIGKNLNASDVTLIEAGGSIQYSTPTIAQTNALQANSAGITLGGPGYLEVLAGGAVNLGDGTGIETTGNFFDSRLPSTSASVVVGAGFGANPGGGGIRLPATDSFISTYVAPDKSGNPGAYASQLVAYMEQLEPVAYANTTYASALTGFESLTFQQQLPFLSQVLMDELSAAGIAYNKTRSFSSYTAGYNAIKTLFPTADSSGNPLTYQGDIDLFFSQIKTDQGGNINLLAPGGSVIVGVPNPPASLGNVKGSLTAPVISPAAELGLLVLASGTIEGFADQSFEVNQSRILTLQGGDIILWASNGDIDAGKGAKTASGASPPVIQTNSQGQVIVNPVGDVSGSGIGQLLTGPGETAGLVNLIAPKGVVNAGDAGIRVAGNLNIAAVQVIGASNITVGGTATGVPVSEAGALSGALAGANSLGDAGKNTVDQLNQNLGGAANFQQLSESLQPTFIEVKMFCLGVDCQLH